jgi:ATP-dependent Clp protease ATP-binding subunit ClpA
MYERFTDRARKVMQLANLEAQRLQHTYIGTEHILLGLLLEGSGLAANVLKHLGIDLAKTRREVEENPCPDQFQIPRAKKVIEYSMEEARDLHHHYVGTEHLLLGLLREKEGAAAQVLTNLGFQLERIREEVLNLLGASMQTPNREGPVSEDDLPNLPNQIRLVIATFNQLIDQLRLLKEEAVAVQDFEKAARLRDQQEYIGKRRVEFIRLYSND